MLDTVKHITLGGKEYPLAFTLNVMESIQEKYGSMEEWGKVLQPKPYMKIEVDEETKEERNVVVKPEPKIKDILWTFKEFINEGIDIENEEKDEKRQFVTEKQVGRLISNIGINNISKIMQDITVDSMKTGNSKNEQTTQNMTETTIQTTA